MLVGSFLLPDSNMSDLGWAPVSPFSALPFSGSLMVDLAERSQSERWRSTYPGYRGTHKYRAGRDTQESGSATNARIGLGSRPLTMSAIVIFSSTERRLARTATHTV